MPHATLGLLMDGLLSWTWRLDPPCSNIKGPYGFLTCGIDLYRAETSKGDRPTYTLVVLHPDPYSVGEGHEVVTRDIFLFPPHWHTCTRTGSALEYHSTGYVCLDSEEDPRRRAPSRMTQVLSSNVFALLDDENEDPQQLAASAAKATPKPKPEAKPEQKPG